MDFKKLKRVFIVAELSANHNGSFENAVKTIKAAKKAGADAIKLQTYTPDTITLDTKSDDFLIKGGTIWNGKYLYDLYEEAYTPWEWHKELFKISKKEGIICFSSPFDTTAVDLLEKLDNPIYKIASFEITDTPLIRYVASKGKPIIISTGIASKKDIELALETCKEEGNDKIALLKCTSSYPAPISEANLSMIKDFRNRYNVISGLSDHTLGLTAPIVAVSQGAKIIEKHFILDRTLGGPDATFSLDQNEFAELVKAIRDAESAIGEVNYKLTLKQNEGKKYCRSLYISKDVKKGEKITLKNVKSVRPGYGLHPKYLNQILGKNFLYDLKKGERLSLNIIN